MSEQTYTQAELDQRMNEHVYGMRKAFDEMVADMERRYRVDTDAMRDAYESEPNIRRWSTWWTWGCFWVSGFFLRGAIDNIFGG